MTQCNCKTKNGKGARCSRNVKGSSKYCYQHQECKYPVKKTTPIEEITRKLEEMSFDDPPKKFKDIIISGTKYKFVKDTRQILKRHTYTDLSIQDHSESYIRVGSIAEGSCLFHAVLFSMDYPGYRDASEKNQMRMVADIRQALGNQVQVEEYILMDAGNTAARDVFELITTLYNDCELKMIFTSIKPTDTHDIYEFKLSLINKIIKHCPYEFDMDLEDFVDELILSSFQNFQDRLVDCSEWTGLGEMTLLSKYLNVNIMSYGDDRGEAYLIDMYKIITDPNNPTIMIFNLRQVHYEPIGRLYKGNYHFMFSG
jgi:hypothetical protein